MALVKLQSHFLLRCGRLKDKCEAFEQSVPVRLLCHFEAFPVTNESNVIWIYRRHKHSAVCGKKLGFWRVRLLTEFRQGHGIMLINRKAAEGTPRRPHGEISKANEVE
jgi:hypothetical protein